MRFLIATDLLLQELLGQGGALPDYPLSDLAVSAVTLEWILAEVERDTNISPAERRKWRTNLTNFRKKLVQSGGQVPALSEEALERWGKALLLDLKHSDGTEEYEMPTEERLVIATASALGLIYLSPARDWNNALQNDFDLSVVVV